MFFLELSCLYSMLILSWWHRNTFRIYLFHLSCKNFLATKAKSFVVIVSFNTIDVSPFLQFFSVSSLFSVFSPFVSFSTEINFISISTFDQFETHIESDFVVKDLNLLSLVFIWIHNSFIHSYIIMNFGPRVGGGFVSFLHFFRKILRWHVFLISHYLCI